MSRRTRSSGKSQKLANLSINEKSREDDEDSDDCDLPEVRLSSDDTAHNKSNVSSNASNSTSPATKSDHHSHHSSKHKQQITGNYEKILKFKEQMAKNEESKRLKQQADELIQRGGFQFDKNAIIKRHELNDDDEMYDDHQVLIDKWTPNCDPLIPLKPELDELFELDFNKVYKYPRDFNLSAFKHDDTVSEYLKLILNGNINQICEKFLFIKYLNQAESEINKECLLSHLFYYATSFNDDHKFLVSTETLLHILTNKKFSTINWKVSPLMITQVFCNLGLNIAQFEESIPKLMGKIELLNEGTIKIVQSKKTKMAPITDEEKDKCFKIFDLIINKTLEMILCSLKTRKQLYNEDELEFIFLLIIYITLDKNYDKLNVKLQTKFILNEVIDSFTEQTWNAKKCELCENVIKLTSKHHHRLLYVNSYFELSKSERIYELMFNLSYNCVKRLITDGHVSYYVQKIELEEMLQLLSELKAKSNAIYQESSYKMFSIVKSIDTIVTQIIKKLPEEDVNKFVDSLTFILTNVRRQTRDRLEYQGRNQVKIIITNLISKCDSYSKDKKQLTMTNTLFQQSTNNDLNNDDEMSVNMSTSVSNNSILNASILPNL